MVAKDGQIQQQHTQLEERATELNRQQKELETLRVRTWVFYIIVGTLTDGIFALLLKGQMVSKSCKSRRSKRLTYLECATATATQFSS